MDEEIIKVIEYLKSRIQENKHKHQAYAQLIRKQNPSSAPYLQLMQEDYQTLLNEIKTITSTINTTNEENSPLSSRENQVLSLVSQGLLRKQISYELGISERTVQFHLKNCIEKLGVESRAEAIRLATQKKYI